MAYSGRHRRAELEKSRLREIVLRHFLQCASLCFNVGGFLELLRADAAPHSERGRAPPLLSAAAATASRGAPAASSSSSPAATSGYSATRRLVSSSCKWLGLFALLLR